MHNTMAPVYCSAVVPSDTELACFVKLGAVYAMPFLRHVGTNTKSPVRCSFICM